MNSDPVSRVHECLSYAPSGHVMSTFYITFKNLKKLSVCEVDLIVYPVTRWLLLCFKREFPELDALRMWEACWARYQTDYFHLFICVAIISVYGEDVVQQDLPADEMLLHFSSLSMHMSGDVILRKVSNTCLSKDKSK